MKREAIQREQRTERKWRRHEVLKRMADAENRQGEKFDRLFDRVSIALDKAGVPVVVKT